MTKNTKSPAQAEVKPIPGPPSGGSWKWDAAAEKWVTNDTEVQPDVKPQE